MHKLRHRYATRAYRGSRNLMCGPDTSRSLVGRDDRAVHSVVINLDGESYRLRDHHAAAETLRRAATGTRQPIH